MLEQSMLETLILNGAYDVIRQQNPAPEPTDEKYVKHSAQVIGREFLNGWLRPVRSVVISGVHLLFDETDRRGIVEKYNDKEDIRELCIVADTIVVSKALRFPQTRVFLVCRELRFTGAKASIDTTPRETAQRELQNKDGRDGAGAGDIVVFASKFATDQTNAIHFIARGAPGQPADEGAISAASSRKDIALITKKQWESLFSAANRKVRHEEPWSGGPPLYESVMPSSECDWDTFQRRCGGSITYVEFRNACWVDAFHGKTRDYQVGAIGSRDEPGEGGAGEAPGKPGTGGPGGNLLSTVLIDPRYRDLRGGSSAPRHPGTPGGSGGTPAVAHWVTFRGAPAGTGAAGANHKFTYEISRKQARVGKASGPGPAPDAPQGADGKDVPLCLSPGDREGAKSAWISAVLLNAMMQYARETASAEHGELARAMLQPYADAVKTCGLAAIAACQAAAGLPREVTGSPASLGQLEDELAALCTRLEQRLDSFGNPPGWVPNLTLSGAVGAYNAVRDIALKELYGAYYLEKMWKQKQDRSEAINRLVEVLIEKTRQLQAELVDTCRAITQRGYVAPADPTIERTTTVDDLAGNASRAQVPFNDMSLIERLRSLIKQMEDLDKKRKEIEIRLKKAADDKLIKDSQWEAVCAGLKIAGTVLKSLPLPPPYEIAASAAGGLLDITSSFLQNGPDETAFKNLKSQVDGFADANQDKLVSALTEGMKEELSAYNEGIKQLDKAGKAAKEAKEKLEAEYKAAEDAAAATREAEIKALSNRDQQRLRQRQPPPDPARSANFNEEIARRALQMQDQRKETDTSAAAYAQKKADIDKRQKAIESTSKDLKEKVEATGKAIEKRGEATKNNIERIKKVASGIEEIAKTINNLSVSQTQINARWDEALAKIQLEDAEFQAYVVQLKYLNEQKTLVVGRLVQLLGKLQELRQQIARNFVAINELRAQHAKSGADDIDHGTLVYIQSMREDAHRRLTEYLYFVTKAYEYYTVSPWNRFYADAQKIFEDLRIVLDQPAVDIAGCFDADDADKSDKERRLKQLIAAPVAAELSSSDWELLKGVYEKPLRDMGIRMLDLITKGEGRINERDKRIVLREPELKGLNARIAADGNGRAVFNLARLDRIENSNEKQRLASFRVMRARGHTLGGGVPDEVTFKVTHLGKSIVRARGHFYAFEPQAGEEGGGPARVTFETNGRPQVADDGTVAFDASDLSEPESSPQENLVSKLLGTMESINLSSFRPGIFSDFLLSVEFTPRDRRLLIDEIEFAVRIEKGNDNTSGQLVTVFNNLDLAIEIAASRPDVSGRSGGISRYLAVFDGSELESSPLIISVPGNYGEYRHVGWSEGARPVPGAPHSCAISSGIRLIALYETGSA